MAAIRFSNFRVPLQVYASLIKADAQRSCGFRENQWTNGRMDIRTQTHRPTTITPHPPTCGRGLGHSACVSGIRLIGTNNIYKFTEPEAVVIYLWRTLVIGQKCTKFHCYKIQHERLWAHISLQVVGST